MADGSPLPKPVDKSPRSKYPLLAPRFWHGMTLGNWLALLARNRFAISWRRLHIVAGATPTTAFNSVCALAQRAIFGRRIARTEIRQPPIFIIGHWRSGTTLLHELLVLDPRFTFPTTYECFAPNQSLVTSWFVEPYMKWLIPRQRPMDNMAAGWDRPQEDEFALANMGVGSPYTRLAFPNRPQNEEFLDLQDVSPPALARWKAGFTRFLRTITVRSDRPIVLKSPPHTARVKLLLELFPEARFIHIVRDPYVVYASTVRLWKSLYDVQGLQLATLDGLEEKVFRDFERMYGAFFAQKELIPPGHLCEVRYEELVRDPLGQMEAIYDQLELGDFAAVRPAMANHLAGQKNYATNRFEIAPPLRAEIARRWAEFICHYGYDGAPEQPAHAGLGSGLPLS